MRATLLKLMTVVLIAAAPSMARAQDNVQVTLVESWYQRFLGRCADPGAIGWVADLSRGTAPVLVEARILGSAEYFNRNGATEPGFIAALYRDVLGASPTPYQMQNDLVRLQQLGCNRDAFAAEFLMTRQVLPAVAPVGYRPTYVAPPRPVSAYRPAYYRPAGYVPGAVVIRPGYSIR